MTHYLYPTAFHKRNISHVWLYGADMILQRRWETTQNRVEFILKAKRSTVMCQKDKTERFSIPVLIQPFPEYRAKTRNNLDRKCSVLELFMWKCIIKEGHLYSRLLIPLKWSSLWCKTWKAIDEFHASKPRSYHTYKCVFSHLYTGK